ncbi:unnamed protein product, partial [Prorocentrum cordatum]
DSAAASSVERLTAEQRSRAVTVVYRRASSVRFAFQSLGPVEEGCSHALLLGEKPKNDVKLEKVEAQEAGSATQTSERSPERRSGGAGRGARGPPGVGGWPPRRRLWAPARAPAGAARAVAGGTGGNHEEAAEVHPWPCRGGRLHSRVCASLSPTRRLLCTAIRHALLARRK